MTGPQANQRCTEHWAGVDAERRPAATLDWDPYYGDRHHHLAVIGIDMDPVHLHRTLVCCLLTDEELSQGGRLAPAY